MFFLEGQVRVQLYGGPVDMRRSFDGVNSRPNGASESRRNGAGSECRFCGLGRVAF